MSNKQPIPIPVEQKWQDFREVILPVIVFLLCIASVIVIWYNRVSPSSVVGEARSANIVLSSPRAGLLTEVSVGRFDAVKKGAPIASIDYSMDPDFADATVEWVRAQVDLLTLTIDPMQRARTDLSYNQLRLDWLNERTSVAALKIELQNSEKEFQRIETLFMDNLVSESLYNKARTDRDSYAVQVQQKEELVASIQQALSQAQENDPSSQLDQAQIKRLDQGLSRVEALLDDIILLSPIDGEIGSISKQTGESIQPGETIATISSSQVKKIVGYVPQPIYLEPYVGMEVEIRTRRPTRTGLFSWLGTGRPVARAKVSKVSNRLEAVGSGVLRNRAAYKKVLPFTIDLIDGEGKSIDLDIHPGELVDIHFIGSGE
jgi:multidrug resistance efflux pump